MTAQTMGTFHGPALTPRQSMRSAIQILMLRANLRTRAQLAKAMDGVMSQTALYGKLTDAPAGPEFTTGEIIRLAEVLDVPITALFESNPSLETLAPHLGLTVEELAEEVASGQYWKMMNGADLEVLPGGDEGGQGRFGHLHLVT